MVDHNSASKECRRRMGAAYALNLLGDSSSSCQEKLNNLRRKLEEDSQKEDQDRCLKQMKKIIK